MTPPTPPTPPTTPGRLRRSGLVACAAVGLVLVLPGVAHADTSTAAAQAASVSLAGEAVLTSGTATVGNDGSQGTVTAGGDPALSVLGSQSLITGGSLTQRSVAHPDGRSAACAGLVGTGGTVSIGADGSCVVNAGTGGVEITLSPTLRIRAAALTSSCTAGSDGSVTARATLTDAGLYTVVLGRATKVLALGSSPAPDSQVTSGLLSPVATVSANARTSTGAGNVTVTALDATLIGGSGGTRIGASICGANARVLPTPALPLHPLTLAGAGVAVAAWGLRARRTLRRRLAGAPTRAGLR